MINSIVNTAGQAIEQKSSAIVPSKAPPAQTEADTSNVYLLKQKKTDEEIRPEEKKKEELTQEMLDEISSDIEALHSVGLSFAQHEGTGRTMVEVFDKSTDELIRQIPAEDILNMAAKMDEMLGLLFDEKV